MLITEVWWRSASESQNLFYYFTFQLFTSPTLGRRAKQTLHYAISLKLLWVNRSVSYLKDTKKWEISVGNLNCFVSRILPCSSNIYHKMAAEAKNQLKSLAGSHALKLLVYSISFILHQFLCCCVTCLIKKVWLCKHLNKLKQCF